MKPTKEEVTQALNQLIEDSNVYDGDRIVNENQKEIELLRQLIDEQFQEVKDEKEREEITKLLDNLFNVVLDESADGFYQPRTLRDHYFSDCKKLEGFIEQSLKLKSYHEQILWEYDIALDQLNELGYEFGEKIFRALEFNELNDLLCTPLWDQEEKEWVLLAGIEPAKQMLRVCSLGGNELKPYTADRFYKVKIPE